VELIFEDTCTPMWLKAIIPILESSAKSLTSIFFVVNLYQCSATYEAIVLARKCLKLTTFPCLIEEKRYNNPEERISDLERKERREGLEGRRECDNYIDEDSTGSAFDYNEDDYEPECEGYCGIMNLSKIDFQCFPSVNKISTTELVGFNFRNTKFFQSAEVIDLNAIEEPESGDEMGYENHLSMWMTCWLFFKAPLRT